MRQHVTFPLHFSLVPFNLCFIAFLKHAKYPCRKDNVMSKGKKINSKQTRVIVYGITIQGDHTSDVISAHQQDITNWMYVQYWHKAVYQPFFSSWYTFLTV